MRRPSSLHRHALGALTAISLLSGTLLGAPTTVEAAERPPDGCFFDPTYGVDGVVEYRFDVATDGRSIAFDDVGVLTLVADFGSDPVDVLRRVTLDGTPDPSFPERRIPSDGAGERAMAVDDEGRIWLARSNGSETQLGRIDGSSFVPIATLPHGSIDDPQLHFLDDGRVLVVYRTPQQTVAVAVDPLAATSAVEIYDAGGFAERDLHVFGVTDSGVLVGGILVWDDLRWEGAVWHPAITGGTGAVLAVETVAGSDGAAFAAARDTDDGVLIGGVLMFGTQDLAFTAMVDSAPDSDPSIVPDSEVVHDELEVLLHLSDEGDGFFAAPAGGFVSALFDPDRQLTSHRSGVEPRIYATGMLETRAADGNRYLAWLNFDSLFLVKIGSADLGPRPSPEALADQVSRLYAAYLGRGPDAAGLAFWSQRRADGMSLRDVSAAFAASSEFIDTFGQLDDGEFVDLVYDRVLGRAPDAAGRAYWVAELGATGDRGGVMAEFSESAEYVARTGTVAAHSSAAGSVERLYRAYFQRDPDAGGACFWERRLGEGDDLRRVSDSFAASAEFVETYGQLDDRAFVELVYENVLGRAGEASGVAFWTGELAAARRTRGEVMIGFSESAEFVVSTGTLPAD